MIRRNGYCGDLVGISAVGSRVDQTAADAKKRTGKEAWLRGLFLPIHDAGGH